MTQHLVDHLFDHEEENEWNLTAHGMIDKYLMCHIISFLPYFYQSKFKRLNNYSLKWIEYHQKYLIIQRILKRKRPHYYDYFEEKGLIEERVLLVLDDLKVLEKKDLTRLNSYMEDPEELAKLIKQMYYLDDFRWLLYWNNVGDNFFLQQTVYDPDMLFDRKYSEIFELEGNLTLTLRHVLNQFFISFSIVGLKSMNMKLSDYLKPLNAIGIVGVEFLYCNIEPGSGKDAKYETKPTKPIFTNCFTSIVKSGSEFNKISSFIPIKYNIQSKNRARKYLLECANAHGVHHSIIPRGELFVNSLFEKENKSKLNWDQAKFFYENSILTVCERLKKPSLGKFMDITQYLFAPILERARKTYLSERSESKFLASLNQFQHDAVVKENKERLEYLLKFVDEDCFHRLSMSSESLPIMVKSIDFETKTKFQKFHLHTSLQIKKYKLENFTLYSWEKDFLHSLLNFMNKKEEPKQVTVITDPPKNPQKKKKFTKVVLDEKINK